MDKSCTSSEMIDDIYFYLNLNDTMLTSDTTKMMADDGDSDGFMSSLSSVTGQGWLIFEELPVGDYKFTVGQFSNVDYTKKTGTMPITIQTFGATNKLEIK